MNMIHDIEYNLAVDENTMLHILIKVHYYLINISNLLSEVVLTWMDYAFEPLYLPSRMLNDIACPNKCQTFL